MVLGARRPAIYDTVTALLREPPPGLDRRGLWNREFRSVKLDSGVETGRAVLNVHKGPALTLFQGGALMVERSLPKALRGQNIDDLRGPEVAVSLAIVDEEVREALGGVALPSIAEWAPVRVDYCESTRLESEAHVLRALDALSGVELPYKGLPVRGQHHSVRWPKGDVQPKAYSKYLETRGDPAALGVLRREAGVFHLATFRDLTGLASPLLLDVLTPELHARAWEPFGDYWRGGAVSGKELGDVRLLRELVDFFGRRRAAALLGHCAIFVAFGVQTRADVLGCDAVSLSTRYRVLADIRAFRAAMAAKGYDIVADGADDGEYAVALWSELRDRMAA